MCQGFLFIIVIEAVFMTIWLNSSDAYHWDQDYEFLFYLKILRSKRKNFQDHAPFWSVSFYEHCTTEIKIMNSYFDLKILRSKT